MAATNIHPQAIVDPKAQLAEGVSVGPFSIIGPNVSIDAGTEVGPHVVIDGHTSIGKNNKIFQFASLGAQPQDKKYAGEPTKLIIGDNNTIREFTTFRTVTVRGRGECRLGNDNWIMAYVHLAHDCVVGNHTIFANNASLAGHVTIGDWVILGGYSLVHQFCILGDYSMTAFAAGVHKDVPPYVMAAGYRAEPKGLNTEGMRRRGMSPEQIERVQHVYKVLYRQGLGYNDAKAQIIELAQSQDEVKVFAEFFAQSTRGVIR